MVNTAVEQIKTMQHQDIGGESFLQNVHYSAELLAGMRHFHGITELRIHNCDFGGDDTWRNLALVLRANPDIRMLDLQRIFHEEVDDLQEFCDALRDDTPNLVDFNVYSLALNMNPKGLMEKLGKAIVERNTRNLALTIDTDEGRGFWKSFIDASGSLPTITCEEGDTDVYRFLRSAQCKCAVSLILNDSAHALV